MSPFSSRKEATHPIGLGVTTRSRHRRRRDRAWTISQAVPGTPGRHRRLSPRCSWRSSYLTGTATLRTCAGPASSAARSEACPAANRAASAFAATSPATRSDSAFAAAFAATLSASAFAAATASAPHPPTRLCCNDQGMTPAEISTPLRIGAAVAYHYNRSSLSAERLCWWERARAWLFRLQFDQWVTCCAILVRGQRMRLSSRRISLQVSAMRLSSWLRTPFFLRCFLRL